MFRFDNDIDADSAPDKISLDDLYEGKQKRDLRVLKTFKTILARVHNQIKLTSRQKIDQQFCWFIIPEFLMGVPSYNNHDCAVYVIEKLMENGFQVKYTHPNLLLISWQHWVPNYVRQEIKKKTGMEIDGNGQYVQKKNSENNLTMSLSNASGNGYGSGSGDGGDRGITLRDKRPPMNLFDNDDYQQNETKNKMSSSNATGGREYKDIKSYNPVGGLVYKENLLNDLQKKLNLH